VISVFPLVRAGEIYVAVRNHTTGKIFFSEKALRRIFQPSMISIAVGPSVLALSAIGFGVVDGFVGSSVALLLTLSLVITGIRRQRHFKRNTPFAEFGAGSSSKPPSLDDESGFNLSHPGGRAQGQVSLTGK
jgi:hypothetical protein